MRWIIGVLFPVIGILMVFYSEKIYQTFGAVTWAETYLGHDGGSRAFYKLIGLLLILVGFAFLTGLHESVILWIAQNFFGALVSKQ